MRRCQRSSWFWNSSFVLRRLPPFVWTIMLVLLLPKLFTISWHTDAAYDSEAITAQVTTLAGLIEVCSRSTRKIKVSFVVNTHDYDLSHAAKVPSSYFSSGRNQYTFLSRQRSGFHA
jgi:hypothetical protein